MPPVTLPVEGTDELNPRPNPSPTPSATTVGGIHFQRRSILDPWSICLNEGFWLAPEYREHGVVTDQSLQGQRSRRPKGKGAVESLLDRLRCQDLATGGGAREPCCDNDRPAEEVSRLGLGIATVDSHP